ncbi:MAG: hypothetical protein KBD21_02845 [Candidatus Pacebacteria bacterium]|nr:hypothetical protein [Candidatus Paceibacterota bacterium]
MKLGDLVPCGDDVVVSGDSKTGYTYCNECSACHLQQLAQNVLNFLVGVMSAVAALLFVNAGILYTTAPTNPSAVSKAHNIFKNTLIGILIILSAYLLIDFGLKALLGENGSVMGFGPWNTILCKDVPSNGCYTMPPIGKIVLDPDTLNLENAVKNGLTCKSIGFDCRKECGTDFVPVTELNSTCTETTPICCKFHTAVAGNACKGSTTGKTGLCISTGATCAVSETATECGILPCCISVNTPPTPPKPDGDYDCNDVDSLKEEFGGAGPVNAPGLEALINCYTSDAEVKKWLSSQTIYTWEKSNPKCNYTNGREVCGACAHSFNSCHYGRGTGKGAMGADFNGTSESALCKAIYAAQKTCGGRVLCEGNHTHVSLNECPGA